MGLYNLFEFTDNVKCATWYDPDDDYPINLFPIEESRMHNVYRPNSYTDWYEKLVLLKNLSQDEAHNMFAETLTSFYEGRLIRLPIIDKKDKNGDNGNKNVIRYKEGFPIPGRPLVDLTAEDYTPEIHLLLQLQKLRQLEDLQFQQQQQKQQLQHHWQQQQLQQQFIDPSMYQQDHLMMEYQLARHYSAQATAMYHEQMYGGYLSSTSVKVVTEQQLVKHRTPSMHAQAKTLASMGLHQPARHQPLSNDSNGTANPNINQPNEGLTVSLFDDFTPNNNGFYHVVGMASPSSTSPGSRMRTHLQQIISVEEYEHQQREMRERLWQYQQQQQQQQYLEMVQRMNHASNDAAKQNQRRIFPAFKIGTKTTGLFPNQAANSATNAPNPEYTNEDRERLLRAQTICTLDVSDFKIFCIPLEWRDLRKALGPLWHNGCRSFINAYFGKVLHLRLVVNKRIQVLKSRDQPSR